MTRLLAIDTSTEACSVALWQDGALLARDELVEREHTRRLLPLMQEVLAEAGVGLRQVDALVCCTGPGSFAGVRIGVALVKGLALGLHRPVIPVSSLALLAQGMLAEGAPGPVVSAIDARMSEIYLGIYERDAEGRAQAVVPDRCLPPDAVAAALQPPWSGAGTGWGTYEHQLRSRLGDPARLAPQALPSARWALPLALPCYKAGEWLDAEALVPAYLRDRVALTLQEQARLRQPAGT